MASRKDLEPIAILLVSKGTKGDRLLFKFPHDVGAAAAAPLGGRLSQPSLRRNAQRIGLNPYAVAGRSDVGVIRPITLDDTPDSLLEESRLTGISDEMMSYLFTVKTELCNRRFELQDVKFVGFPMEAPPRPKGAEEAESEDQDILLFSLIIALRAEAESGIVSLYQDLSKRVGLAIRHEEARCGFLSAEAGPIIAILEEWAALPEAEAHGSSPYEAMLAHCRLPQLIKIIFQDVSERGFCSVHVNSWVEVSFAIPEKLYARLELPSFSHGIEAASLGEVRFRPYHGLLLLEEAVEVLSCLPLDSSPALVRLLSHLSPLKSLEATAADLDLPVSQVSLLARHLLSWGKAIIIYPLCETNLYTLAPDVSLTSNRLMESFAERFAGGNLLSVLAEFSPTNSVGEFLSTSSSELQPKEERVGMIVWLLRRQIIRQLHTFLYVSEPLDPRPGEEDDEDDTADVSIDVTGMEAEWRGEVDTAVAAVAAHASVTPSILAAVRRIAAEPPSATLLEDLRLFGRVVGFCGGQAHLEEVMYCENLTRADLLRCLDRFRAVIVAHIREDDLIRPPFAAKPRRYLHMQRLLS